MSARARLTGGLLLLALGLVVAVIQALLVLRGDAPCFSGLSLLALLSSGVGAWVALTSHDSVQLSPQAGEEPSEPARRPGAGE